jgi:hypothetical protein
MPAMLNDIERVGESRLPPAFPAAIASGGQTGADRAALDFAIAHGILHVGFCPRGRKAEDGPIPARYKLTETESADYPERTRRNVELADATVIFSSMAAADLLQQHGTGTALTAREAARAGRPYLVLGNFPEVGADAGELRAFLEKHRPKVLNVAGSRESSRPGIAAHVAAVLAAVAAKMPAAAGSPTYGGSSDYQ